MFKNVLIRLPETLYKALRKKAIDENLSLKQVFIMLSELYISGKINLLEVKNGSKK